MRRIAATITGLIIIVLLSACGSTVKNPTRVSALETQSHPYTQQEYFIQPGDELDIKFFYNADLNEELIPVRPDGRISLQLAHDIMAAGLTPAQLTEELTKQYRKELKEPAITVIVRSFSRQRVFVGGEVNLPGIIEMKTPMTVLQSIFNAGGTKETARTKEVLVIRRSANNEPMVIPVNIEKAIRGTDPSQDITLLPFDVVYVPMSRIANVNKFVMQYIRNNLPANIGFGFSYNLNPDNE